MDESEGGLLSEAETYNWLVEKIREQRSSSMAGKSAVTTPRLKPSVSFGRGSRMAGGCFHNCNRNDEKEKYEDDCGAAGRAYATIDGHDHHPVLHATAFPFEQGMSDHARTAHAIRVLASYTR